MAEKVSRDHPCQLYRSKLAAYIVLTASGRSRSDVTQKAAGSVVRSDPLVDKAEVTARCVKFKAPSRCLRLPLQLHNGSFHLLPRPKMYCI